MAQYVLGIYSPTVASALSVPTGITFSPASNVNVIGGNPTGQVVATATVTMSPIGASFTGSLALQNSDQGHYTFSGSQLVTAVTPLSSAPSNLIATATQNGTTTSNGGAFTASAIYPSPISITWSPASPSLVNTSPANTFVATATVAMSLTSAVFPSSGTLALLVSDSSNFSVSGLSVYTAQTPLSIGTHNITGLATDPLSATSTSNGGQLAISVASSVLGNLVGVMSLTNIAGSAAPNPFFYSFGSPFARGAVPSGNIITADVSGVNVPLGMIQQNTGPDGSTEWAEFHADFSAVTAINGAVSGAGVMVNLRTIAGAYSAATARSTADLFAHDFKVVIPALTTTCSSAADLDGAGTWTASVNASGTTILTISQSPVGARYVAIAPFYNGTTKHRFLQSRFYIDDYQKTDTTQGPISLMTINENAFAFYSTAGGSFSYDCTLQDGATVIRSRTSISHNFMSMVWLCGTDGLSDWIGGSAAKMYVTQPLNQLRLTKKIPPYAPTAVTLPINIKVNSVSLGSSTFLYSQAHGIGGAGALGIPVQVYSSGALPGGLSPDTPVYAYYVDSQQLAFFPTYSLASQTGAIPNLAAQQIKFSSAGSGNIWVALAASPTGPGEINPVFTQGGERPDIGPLTGWNANDFAANDPSVRQEARVNAMAIAAIWDLNIRGYSTQRIVSLLSNSAQWPTLSENLTGAQRGNSYSRSADRSTGFSSDIRPWSGGQGWIQAPPEGSHFPHAVYGVWLMEGGQHFLDAAYMQGNRAIITENFIPSRNPTVTGGKNWFDIIVNNSQGRVSAWNLRDLTYAAFMAPTGSDESKYFQYHVNNQFGFLADTISHASVAQQFTGSLNMAPSTSGGNFEGFSYWYLGMIHNLNYMLFSGYPALTNNISAVTQSYNRELSGLLLSNCPYYASSYRIIDTYPDGTYVGAWDDFGFTGGSQIAVTYQSNGNTVQLTSNVSTLPNPLANGDKALACFGTEPVNASAVGNPPPEITKAVWYYLTNVSGSTNGMTFQLATTSALDVPVTWTNTSNAAYTSRAFVWHWESACPPSFSGGVSTSNDAAHAQAAMGWYAANLFSSAATAFTIVSSRVGNLNWVDNAKYNLTNSY